MNQVLKIWVEKEGLTIDKETTFDIKENLTYTIIPLDKPHETVKILLEKGISVEEYQNGFIGKYRNELSKYLLQFIQKYALLNGLNIVIDPTMIQSNEVELYETLRLHCQENNLVPLLKP